MNAFEHFAAGWGGAMEILADAHTLSVLEMCRAGLDTKMAKQIAKLAGVYFDPCRSPGKQQQARGFAEERRHTLFTLDHIETIVGRLKNKKKAWEVRHALTQEPAVLRTLTAAGNKLLERFNGPEKAENTPAISAKAIPGSTYANFRVRAPGHLVQAAMDALGAGEGPGHAAERAMKILAGGGGEAGPPITPAVIISLADYAKVMAGEGDDVLLSLTNGTRMTGADFVRAELDKEGFVLLVDPVEGPVNLYRTQRFASRKQRLITRLVDPVCAARDCGVGADYAEVNHNVAWKANGETNLNNLSTICGFHNGRNDDDRSSPRYGYLDQIGGQTHHFSPFGGEPVLNDHPVARGGAMRVI